MYWVCRNDGRFEVLDGQQRTLSICHYVNGNFSHNMRFFTNLHADEKESVLNYELQVYFCGNLDCGSEKDFFKIKLRGKTFKRKIRERKSNPPGAFGKGFVLVRWKRRQVNLQLYGSSPARQKCERTLALFSDCDCLGNSDFCRRYRVLPKSKLAQKNCFIKKSATDGTLKSY